MNMYCYGKNSIQKLRNMVWTCSRTSYSCTGPCVDTVNTFVYLNILLRPYSKSLFRPRFLIQYKIGAAHLTGTPKLDPS